jgi:hypothetical protein
MVEQGISFGYTVATLKIWGKWSRYRVGGYPTQSAFVHRVRGRPVAPEGVEAMDRAIAGMALIIEEAPLQRRIKIHYQRECPVREILKELSINSRIYYEELEEAQWAVHAALCQLTA